MEWLVLEVIAGGSVQHCMMDAHPLLRKDAAVGIDISGGIIYIVLLELSVDAVDWRRRCLLRETRPPLASRPAEPAKVAIQLLRIHDLCRRDDGGEDKITWHDEWRRTCVHVQSTHAVSRTCRQGRERRSHYARAKQGSNRAIATATL